MHRGLPHPFIEKGRLGCVELLQQRQGLLSISRASLIVCPLATFTFVFVKIKIFLLPLFHVVFMFLRMFQIQIQILLVYRSLI